MLAILAVAAVVLGTPLVALGALTAAIARPGRQAPSLDRMARVGALIGCGTVFLGAAAWPIGLIGVATLVISLAISRFNAQIPRA